MSYAPELLSTDDNFNAVHQLPDEQASERLKVVFSYDGMLHRSSGVSNYILTLGDYLSGRGHEVSYMVAETQIHDASVRAMAKTISLPTNGSRSGESLPASRKLLADTFEEIDPDVLHSQLPFNPMVSGRGLRYIRPDTALIGTFHSLPETRSAKLAVRAIAQMTKGRIAEFDETFAASTALQKQALSTYGVSPALLPLPVDIAKLDKGERISAYDDDRINLLFLGRLEQRKGCQHLLGALSLLDTDTRNHIRLLVAGDGPMKSELEGQVISSGLQNTVEFLGDVPAKDKPDLFATSDIAVFPAVSGESFGLVLAEAMAGTKGVVVGGNNRGYRDALAHRTGTLFNPTAHVETAEFLRGLIKNDVLRHSIRKFQRQLVKDYDITTIGPIIEDAYSQALASRVEKA